MTESCVPRVELGELGLDRGGHLLVKRALASTPAIEVVATPGVQTQLAAWCRTQGHRVERKSETTATVHAANGRWRGAERTRVDEIVDEPPARWGLAARGAAVEIGTPELWFSLSRKSQVWSDEAARLYAQAAAAQWDPATAIRWHDRRELPAEIEDAVVQVMTYLVENETAALIVPARFCAQVHPHFREVQQLLAIQAADEARHVEVFTRRALLWRDALGLSTAGGQASLVTLLDEPDFALAELLLGVMGEGTFLSLLRFLDEHAPDPVTRDAVRLARQDEARHVAFGLGHLARHCALDASLRPRLARAIEARHRTLSETAGLNEEVFDALVVLAAGSWDSDAIRAGWDAVVALGQEMHDGRRARLERLGFTHAEAVALSALHTKNFM